MKVTRITNRGFGLNQLLFAIILGMAAIIHYGEIDFAKMTGAAEEEISTAKESATEIFKPRFATRGS